MSFKGAKKPGLWGLARYCHRVLDSVSARGAPNDIYMEMYKDNSHKTGIHSHYIMEQRLVQILAGNDSDFPANKILQHTCSIFTSIPLFVADVLSLLILIQS